MVLVLSLKRLHSLTLLMYGHCWSRVTFCDVCVYIIHKLRQRIPFYRMHTLTNVFCTLSLTDLFKIFFSFFFLASLFEFEINEN